MKLMIGWLTASAPLGAMFDDPVGQRPFEADIMAGFLGLDPFVFEDLFALRLKFAIKRRVSHQIPAIRTILIVARHNANCF